MIRSFILKKRRYVLDNGLIFRFNRNRELVMELPNGEIYEDCDDYELMDIAEDNGLDFRICNFCGKPYSCGFTSEDGFYSCEECFDEKVNQGFYNAVDDDGYNGYYLDVNGEGTGIYYTEW